MLKENRDIKTDDDYSDYASQMFEGFLERLLTIEWATRKVNDDDPFDDEVDFVWTRRAMRLIENYKRRLYDVGYENFPEGDIFIYNNTYYQEY